jgi:hypothetical protein
VRALVAGAAPHARAWLRARAQVAGFDAAAHHEAGPSVQMMRVRFCLEAAEKPSYPAAYGILAMSMWSFAVLLSYVVWPRHMMVRRATSARGVVLFRLYASAGGATGSGRLPLASPAQAWGGDTARRRFIGGGRVPRFHNSIPPSKQNRLGKQTPRTMCEASACKALALCQCAASAGLPCSSAEQQARICSVIARA